MDDITPGKRKRADELLARSSTTSHGTQGDFDPLTAKRIRYDDAPESVERSSPLVQFSAADLPPEILQHVFSFVHPVTLGHLLRVCRKFNTLLDPSKVLPTTETNKRCVLIQKQNDIWALSRRLYLPGYPRPLNSMTEPDMWKLLRVKRCQFCQRRAKSTPSFLNSVPWTGGPGREDVRTIWPFRVRSCGACIETRLRQETELLLSGSSVLRPGLPFALFTPSFNYVTSVTLRQQQPPTDLKLAKYHYVPDIEELENQLVEVQALGGAAAEEWFKGLQLSGKQKQEDAERLEQWESALTARLQIAPSTSAARFPVHTPSPSLPSVISTHSQPSTALLSYQASTNSPLRPFSGRSSQYSGYAPASSFNPVPDMPLPSWTPAPGQTQPREGAADNRIGSSGRLARSQAATAPSAEHLKRIQSAKRAEIEMRCQQIDPPIRASVLPFMDAFRTALSIPMPLNDSAWDHLKARLLAQRAEAELKEREYLVRQETSSSYGGDATPQRQPSLIDENRNARTWAELGMPSRQKLKEFADEYITSIWDGGISVTGDTAAKFAVDLIIQVKKRFDASIVEEDQELASRGMVLPADSDIHNIRRLKLEDMKWLYDESVRPHTERFGKEIFLCNQCETSAKRLAFDGLIQHYAAKHTSDLSRGPVTVYWKSDWPKFWPFQTASDSVWEHGQLPESTNFHRPREFGRMDWPSNVKPSSPTQSTARTPLHASESLPGRRTLYEEHQDEVVNSAVVALDATAHIRGLTDSIRLYVVIDHVVRSFSRAFPHPPALSLFADSVAQQPRLRRLRDFHGLRCLSCIREGISAIGDTREYWLPQLLDHFQVVHIQHGPAALPNQWAPQVGSHNMQRDIDWTYDMVDLPHPQIIRNILQLPELHGYEFGILVSAFPHLVDGAARNLQQPSAKNPDGKSYQNHMNALMHASAYVGDNQRYFHEDNLTSISGHRNIRDTTQETTAGTSLDVGRSARRDLLASYYEPSPGINRIPKAVDERSRLQETFYEAQKPYPPRGLPFRPHSLEEPTSVHYREASPQFLSEETSRYLSNEENKAGDPSDVDRAMTDVDNFLNSFDPKEDGDKDVSRPASTRARSAFNNDGLRNASSGKVSHVTTPSRPFDSDTGRRSSEEFSPAPLLRGPLLRHTDTSTRGQYDTIVDFLERPQSFNERSLYRIADGAPENVRLAYYERGHLHRSDAPRYYVRRESVSPEAAATHSRSRYPPDFPNDRDAHDRSWHSYEAAAHERLRAEPPLQRYEPLPRFRGHSDVQMYSPPLSGTDIVDSIYNHPDWDEHTQYGRSHPHPVYVERRPHDEPLYNRQADLQREYMRRRPLPEASDSRDDAV